MSARPSPLRACRSAGTLAPKLEMNVTTALAFVVYTNFSTSELNDHCSCPVTPQRPRAPLGLRRGARAGMEARALARPWLGDRALTAGPDICFTSRSVSGYARTSSSYASSEASLTTTRSRSDILRTACFDVVDMLIDVDGKIITDSAAVLNKYRLFLKGLLRDCSYKLSTRRKIFKLLNC